MAELNQSPVYSDCFHLSYQNILFMSFHFRVFNYTEVVSNIRPINIYFYTIHLQKWRIMPLQKNGMHMTGYILIRHNFLCDSALLDLAFFSVYSKPAHR